MAGVTDKLLTVHIGSGCDLPTNPNHVVLGPSLASDFVVRVLLEVGVEYLIRYLIAELIWVGLRHRFKGE